MCSVAHKLFDGTRSNVEAVCARKRVDYDAARPRSSQLPAEPYLNHRHGYRDSVPHCGGHRGVRVIAHNKASAKVCSTHPDNLGEGFTAFAEALCKLDHLTPGALCQAGRNTIPNAVCGPQAPLPQNKRPEASPEQSGCAEQSVGIRWRTQSRHT